MSPYQWPIGDLVRSGKSRTYESLSDAKVAQQILVRDGKIANWLFKACLCGEDTPVDRTCAADDSTMWEGLRVCKSCGTRWEIQLGGRIDACGAIMTEPYGLWLHRQRYRWAMLRWLNGHHSRRISLNPNATRHRDVFTPTLGDLELPAWPLYFWYRLMEWTQEPIQSVRRFRGYVKQFLAPMTILGVLKKQVMPEGKVSAQGWTTIVRDESDGRIRTVSVHLISGQWSLHVEEPARAEETAPFPPVSYRAGDDMLELVGLLTGQRERSGARGWLLDHGYSPPERIGLHRLPASQAQGEG